MTTEAQNTPVSTPSGPSAGLERQDATQETQDATEAAQRRVERWAEAIQAAADRHGVTLTEDWHPEARAAMAVADAEHHQRLAEIDAVAQTEKDATIAELRAEVERLRALAVPVADLVQELKLARQNLHHARAMGSAHFARAEAAEARVAVMDATVAKVRELAENGPFLTRWIDGSKLIDADDLRIVLDAPKDSGAAS